MGVRFHRSVRIVKGVRLNISKSGLGLSVGPRGAKISFGPSGVYSNVGIPGTGLSVRKKIGNVSSRSNRASHSSTVPQKKKLDITVEISIDDETGVETVTLSHDGKNIDDSSLLRRIRRDADFKEKLQKVREKTNKQVQEKTHVLVEMHTYSLPLPNWKEKWEEVKNTQPATYTKLKFDTEKPSIESIDRQLDKEAAEAITSFFHRGRKRKAYKEQRRASYYEAAEKRWLSEKELFEKEEEKHKRLVDQSYQQSYDQWMEEQELLFHPTVDYLSQKLSHAFSAIQLPVEFLVSFEVKEMGKKIYLDIDLPEREDYPQKKSRILSTGKVSIKNKTKKEKNFDYLRSISGMSIYFASVVFSLSPVIEEVLVSGYTQRLNQATGKKEDVYVYSVKYDLERFAQLNFNALSPEVTISSFEHRMEITAQNDLKAIVPF